MLLAWRLKMADVWKKAQKAAEGEGEAAPAEEEGSEAEEERQDDVRSRGGQGGMGRAGWCRR